MLQIEIHTPRKKAGKKVGERQHTCSRREWCCFYTQYLAYTVQSSTSIGWHHCNYMKIVGQHGRLQKKLLAFDSKVQKRERAHFGTKFWSQLQGPCFYSAIHCTGYRGQTHRPTESLDNQYKISAPLFSGGLNCVLCCVCLKSRLCGLATIDRYVDRGVSTA